MVRGCLVPLAIAGPFWPWEAPGLGLVRGLAARLHGWGWQGALAPSSSLFPLTQSAIFISNY